MDRVKTNSTLSQLFICSHVQLSLRYRGTFVSMHVGLHVYKVDVIMTDVSGFKEDIVGHCSLHHISYLHLKVPDIC